MDQSRAHFASDHDLPEGEDWYGNRKLVLAKLDALDRENRELKALVVSMQTQLAVLTAKVTLYSAGIALVVSALAELAVKLIGK